MREKTIGFAIGRLMQVLGLAMTPPFALALFRHHEPSFSMLTTHPEVAGFAIAIAASWAFGSLLVIACRKGRGEQGVKEGIVIVTAGWLILTLLGCVPFFAYFLHGASQSHAVGFGEALRCFTDAFFETMSGFSTTGASIIADVEAMPQSILLWRALTHWLGGMGVVTLALALFPAMGVSGYHMFRSETVGPLAEKLQPRLAETAKVLWGVYVLLTAAEASLLCAGGMPFFDSICHAFATVATGGFSTKNASIGAYNSAYIEWVVIAFMFLSGVNFLLHYRVIFHGEMGTLTKNSELRFYAGAVLAVVVAFTAVLYIGGLPSAEKSAAHYRNEPPQTEEFSRRVEAERGKVSTLDGAFRRAAFQVVSMTTTTGFVTADFDVWPNFCRYVLILMMIVGGCAGSTSGGIKMVRVLVALKSVWRQIRRKTQPRLILPIKVGGQVVPEDHVGNMLSFFILYVLLFAVGVAAMTFFVPDVETAFSSVAATIGGVGPGLSGCGAMENYGWIPVGGKWVLSAFMFLGRLEIFTVIVVLRVSFWRD